MVDLGQECRARREVAVEAVGGDRGEVEHGADDDTAMGVLQARHSVISTMDGEALQGVRQSLF